MPLQKKYLSPEDVAFVQKALVYAVDCHSGQFRQSGEPYIIHPIQVAGILAKLKLDAVTVACGFLHDVVEDTDATLDDLEREFGHDVRVILPYYDMVEAKFGDQSKNVLHFESKVGWRSQYVGVKRIVRDGVTFYFIDNQHYFFRGHVYGDFDDGERFAFFQACGLRNDGTS